MEIEHRIHKHTHRRHCTRAQTAVAAQLSKLTRKSSMFKKQKDAATTATTISILIPGVNQRGSAHESDGKKRGKNSVSATQTCPRGSPGLPCTPVSCNLAYRGNNKVTVDEDEMDKREVLESTAFTQPRPHPVHAALSGCHLNHLDFLILLRCVLHLAVRLWHPLSGCCCNECVALRCVVGG